MIPEIVIGPGELLRLIQTWIDLLFTMSDITHVTIHPDSACEVMFRGRYSLGQQWARLRSSSSDVAAFATIRLA